MLWALVSKRLPTLLRISARLFSALTGRISTAKGSTMVTVMRYGNIILGVALILCYPFGLLTKRITLGFTSTFMMVYCM